MQAFFLTSFPARCIIILTVFREVTALSSFCVFEMEYTSGVPAVDIVPVPFSDELYSQYEHIYNECFLEMRRALGIEPYSFYSDISQLADKRDSIFLLMDGGIITGSVACLGNEIDDLIVNKLYQGKGFGRKLLMWATAHIREQSDAPIRLTVAEWNQRAYRLYLQSGFRVVKKVKVN